MKEKYAKLLETCEQKRVTLQEEQKVLEEKKELCLLVKVQKEPLET